MTSLVLGIDIGATNLKVGLVQGATLLATEHHPVSGRTPEALVTDIAQLVSRLDPAHQAKAIGLACAGVIDVKRGVIRESPNYATWRDVPLASLVQAQTQRTVVLMNDANAVILGEQRFGAAQGHSNLIGFTLGTGVGGAIIIEDQLYLGPRGMAAELGHLTIVREGRPCGCGNRGCLEQYASQVGLRQSVREDATLSRLLRDSAKLPAQLAQFAQSASFEAQYARQHFVWMGQALGQACATLLHTLDIPTFLFTGGLSAAFPLFAPALEREVRSRAFQSMCSDLQFLHGRLGADAGILGAASVASESNHS